MTAPVRDAFDIPYHDVGPRDADPWVALIAGLHGNELNGVFVLSRLAGFLTDVAAGARKPLALRGRVIVVPAVNVLGVNVGRRAWPFDGTDLNRMFPGYDAGETTQRIARAVFEATRAARYRIDVHSSNPEFEELPQVRLYDPSPDERRDAALFGLPAVIERRGNPIFTSTIGHAWKQSPGESFVLQVGQGGMVQLAHCERLFRALVGFISRVGVLAGTELASEDDEVRYFGLRQTLPLMAERAGLFVSTLQVGAWLSAGDTIGYVYDGFDGSLRATITTPRSGLLSGLRRQSILFEGDLVARMQTREEVSQEADTYLYGHGQ
jgi:hypothetical protein